jgi:phosphoenolpyruvate carboxykinase (GTP)
VGGQGGAAETPIGYVPRPEDLNVDGLDVPAADVAELLKVDPEDWRSEIPSIEEHYAQFGDKLPPALRDELANLEKRLSS